MKGEIVVVTPEEMFLIATMKDMGIDRETTATVAAHLKTTERIRLMWHWLKSLETIPSNDEVLNKLVQLIENN